LSRIIINCFSLVIFTATTYYVPNEKLQATLLSTQTNIHNEFLCYHKTFITVAQSVFILDLYYACWQPILCHITKNVFLVCQSFSVYLYGDHISKTIFYWFSYLLRSILNNIFNNPYKIKYSTGLLSRPCYFQGLAYGNRFLGQILFVYKILSLLHYAN